MDNLTIKINAKKKHLKFGETLTTGSVYSVTVDGGADACGADAALIVSTPPVCDCPDGVQVAVATLVNGVGTLNLNCDAMLRFAERFPCGMTLMLKAVIRCFDSGEERHVGVGDALVVIARPGTEDAATGTVVYYKGEKGEKGDKGDKGEKGDKGDAADNALAGETLETATLPKMRQSIGKIGAALGATVACILLAFVSRSAGVETVNVNDINLDAGTNVVTSVDFDGLATTGELAGVAAAGTNYTDSTAAQLRVEIGNATPADYATVRDRAMSALQEHQSLGDYYTKSEVDAAIAEIDFPEIDSTRLISEDGTRWQDATGTVWEVVHTPPELVCIAVSGTGEGNYYASGSFDTYSVGYGERFNPDGGLGTVYVVTNAAQWALYRQTGPFSGDVFTGAYSGGDSVMFSNGSVATKVFSGGGVLTNVVGHVVYDDDLCEALSDKAESTNVYTKAETEELINGIPYVIEGQYNPGYAKDAERALYAESVGHVINSDHADLASQAETAWSLFDGHDYYGHYYYAPKHLLDAAATAATNYTDSVTNALARVIPRDVARTQTDATFVGPSTNSLFYLRQATTQLAGLMTAADKVKLNNATTPADVTAAIREQSLGGIWDETLQVWWTPVMSNGSLTYQATTNVNLNAEN